MITISDIATYIPSGFQDNASRIEEFHVDQNFIETRIGVLRASRKGADEETSDMCVRAFETMQTARNIAAEEIDLLVVCTQNPDGNGMPQVSALLQARLGLRNDICAFDISLACSGYVYSIAVINSMMTSLGFKKALLFTCDPYSKILDPNDRDTALLFGDAATVTLLELNSSTAKNDFKSKAFAFSTHGEFAETVNNRSGQFHMDGRDVVMFTLRHVPKEIGIFLDKHDMKKESIDRFIFHQGSLYIIDQLKQRMGLNDSQVPTSLELHGNTVSSSIPITLQPILHDPSVNRMVLCGFGVGLSIGNAILER